MSGLFRPLTRSACAGCMVLVSSSVLCVIGGCGDPRAKITGVVTLDGRPLHWGTVSFYDNQGGIHRAEIDGKGRYEINGVPAGVAKVAVVSMKQYLRDRAAKPMATLEALEKNPADRRSDATLSEEQLRAVLGAPPEGPASQPDLSRARASKESPTVTEEDLSHIPMRYADITSSGLSCSVQSPTQVYNIELTCTP